jgi:hypothetical protein
MTGQLTRDPLVDAIFAAIKQEQCSPGERRLALVRAGLIAQAYQFQDEVLMDSVFASASGDRALHDNDDLHLRPRHCPDAGAQ